MNMDLSLCRCVKCGSLFINSLGAKQYHAKKCSARTPESPASAAVAK